MSMPVAFVLVDVETGRVEEVLDRLLRINEVVEAYSIAGPYSIVTKVETNSFQELVRVIPQNVHTIPGIKRTMTLLAFGTGKEFRVEACGPAESLARSGKMKELYELCRGCRQLKLCSFGARVVTYGI